ncbi:hypothetical protein [Methylobacterium iners]|uniref:Uncharacterized protein n=1 Tax=Methylobacterium iners TaxID=418707 RepID=A0ABQ4RYE9_9HYPH|nr:hypothetical protein [Methylobacterium iners]GJD95870.1 hypothetical protein OCOJLMKI_3086 [Methylobacterium iners]
MGQRWSMCAAVAATLVLGFVLPEDRVHATEATTIYGMTLLLPGSAEGWTRKDLSDGVILQKTLPSDPAQGRRRPGAALIQITKPTAPNTPFPTAFQGYVAGLKALARQKPITKGTGVTVNGHAFAFERRCCGRANEGQPNEVRADGVFVGVGSPRAHHFLSLTTLQLSSDDAKPVEAEFEAVVRSLRPGPDDRPFALQPPKDGGGLDGTYTHLSTGIRPNPFGGTDFYAENEIMMFAPSGLYSREIPKDGLTLAEHCRATPTDCGTYRLSGRWMRGAERIELTEVENRFGMLSREEKPLTRKGEDLVIGEAEYRRIAPLPEGSPFEGTWRYLFAQSGSGAFSSGSIAVERTLSFSRDGRFRRTGGVGFSSSTDTGTGTTGLAGSNKRLLEEGRYEVMGHALTLLGDDGRSERLSLFAPEHGSDRLLVINGGNYLKQDRAKR